MSDLEGHEPRCACPSRRSEAAAQRQPSTLRTQQLPPTWWGSDDEHDAADARWRASLHRGETITGPAIVELPTTTIVVYPRWRLDVNERGDFVLVRQAPTPIAAEEAA